MKIKSSLLTAAAVFSLGALPAGAAIVSGDLALIGMGADSGFKSLSFVVINTIQAGETVTFTDSGWFSAGSFRGGEGGATFTFPTITLPGTVIAASGTTGATWAFNTGWSSADNTIIGTNGMNFSTSGDNIFAFTGVSTSPTFLFGISSLAFVATSTTANNTAVPSSLTVGQTAVAKSDVAGEFDNIYYSGSTSFSSPNAALLAIADSSNWTGNNTSYSPATSFTIIPEPDAAAVFGALGSLGLLRRRR